MFSKGHLLQAQRNPSLLSGNYQLSIEELEAIRLCDLLQIEQSEAADRMGVSRKTFWNDLQNARQKVLMLSLTEKRLRFLEENTLILVNARSVFSAKNAIMCGKQSPISTAPQAVRIVVPI
ncbi:DUF134 domain-containing protein [Methanosarcina horonobensis]|uniref:DUF134 domain-containing protein n=1 Tax=Methanosarcina horonobensis TaxID=418008 RepID=UPI0022B8EF58|nr:DUF134 domain-containing protein [Methanosarcina horonobensis]